MRYAFALNDKSIRNELDAATVARFAAEGIPLAIVRRRHYRRGTEQHVGEYTDAEHAAMLADGWELVKVLADGDDVAPTAAPVVTEAQALATANPELPGEARAAFGELAQLVALGVQLDLSGELPGWPAITAAIAAAKAAATTLEQLRDLCAHADAADGHWRAVVTWCGDYATAYRLAPELAAIGV